MFALPNFVDFVGSIKQRNIHVLTTISCIKHLIQEFEDAKGVIRICKWKKNRQHNGQQKKWQKDKQLYTKHTHKTQDRVTRTALIIGDELRCSGTVGSSCPTSGTGLKWHVRKQIIPDIDKDQFPCICFCAPSIDESAKIHSFLTPRKLVSMHLNEFIVYHVNRLSLCWFDRIMMCENIFFIIICLVFLETVPCHSWKIAELALNNKHLTLLCILNFTQVLLNFQILIPRWCP